MLSLKVGYKRIFAITIIFMSTSDQMTVEKNKLIYFFSVQFEIGAL